MTDIIPPDPNDPERILVFGGPGAGKSRCGLTIAEATPNSTMYVLDNDFAWTRMNSRLKLPNLDITQIFPDDWEPATQALKSINNQADKQDWLNVDGMTSAWSACQNSYCVRNYGMDMEVYFAKKKKEGGDGFEGNSDYQIINPMWNKFLRLILEFPGHVIMTSEMEPLNPKERDPIIKEMFGPVGSKPRGQKRVPHLPHTTLMLNKGRVGRRITTIKDREREEWQNEEFSNFAVDYLQATANWRKERNG